MPTYREHDIAEMREIKAEQDYYDRLEAEYQAREAARRDVHADYDPSDGHTPMFPEADDPDAYRDVMADTFRWAS